MVKVLAWHVAEPDLIASTIAGPLSTSGCVPPNQKVNQTFDTLYSKLSNFSNHIKDLNFC